MTRVIGIDPGQTGAYCVLDNRDGWRLPDGRLECVALEKLPYYVPSGHKRQTLERRKLADLLRYELVEYGRDDTSIDLMVIERPISTPRKGHSGQSRQHADYGAIVGVCETLAVTASPQDVPVDIVQPGRWQRDLGMTTQRGESRSAHKRRIRDTVDRELVARMSHQSGRAARLPIYAADAAAIALWALREAKVRRRVR